MPEQTALKQWSDKTKYRFVKLMLDNQKSIDICLNFARSINNFAISKSPLSFIEGGVRIVSDLAGNLNGYSHQFFNQKNGWEKIVDTYHERPLYTMFEPILKQYAFKHLPFKHDRQADVGIYYTPVGELGFDKNGFWFQPANGQGTHAKILNFFISEKMKGMKSKFFSIVASSTKNNEDDRSYSFDIQDEIISNIPSATSDRYVEYFKSFLDKGIRRSFLFTGVPGTGKTTLSQTIVNNLGFKTLKFRYDPTNIKLPIIQFLVQSLGIEAIILDDFDQLKDTNTLLEFLSWIHNNTKLVLLITNTLNKFHPAILRPERVDKIFIINEIDISAVEQIFGDKHPEIIDKVKHWPIAFINELAFRIKANPDADFTADIEELEARVNRQKLALKDQ